MGDDTISYNPFDPAQVDDHLPTLARLVGNLFALLCGTPRAKEGVMDSVSRSAALHALAPGLVIWECDLIVYRAGWVSRPPQGVLPEAAKIQIRKAFENAGMAK